MNEIVLLLVAQTTTLLPIDLPDAEKRVIVDFELGFVPVLNAAVDDGNLFLEGIAALGSRAILWPTLNVYGLGTGTFDLRGVPEEAAHSSIAHRFDDARALLLHLAYAELEGIAQDGILADFHLRAGRQFHFSRVGLTFDGVTLGYDGEHAKAIVRVGSRSSIFDRTQGDSGFFDGGLLVGGELGWDFGPEFPLAIEAEVLHFRRTLSLLPGDRPLESGASEIDQRTTTGELRVDYVPLSDLIVSASAEFTLPAISHVRAAASFAIADMSVVLDFDQKIGRDLFFDIGGGEGLTRRERRTTYETFRLNLVDPKPYSDLEAAVLLPIGWLELEPRAGFRAVYGEQASSSPFDATHFRYGLTAYGSFRVDGGNGFEAHLGYQGVAYLRGSESDGTFRDRAAGGENLSHEASAGVRYIHGGGFHGRRLLANRTLSIGAQGFARFAHFDNRYLENEVDGGAYGFGADAQWQIARYVGVRAAYELARDSSVFYDDLGVFHAVRVAVRGSF
jgi:hypothetical protein